jgi:hypothetical protein
MLEICKFFNIHQVDWFAPAASTDGFASGVNGSGYAMSL